MGNCSRGPEKERYFRFYRRFQEGNVGGKEIELRADDLAKGLGLELLGRRHNQADDKRRPGERGGAKLSPPVRRVP